MLYSPIANPVAAPAYMHIPDGYLSPVTCLIMFLLVLPFWYRGIQKMRQTLNARSVPLIALLAAFSFIVMMFNVPLPGGTTGHAVAGALAAIILGPEIATIAISIALVIQALFFGDGGILAIGVNCFNMAVVLPYVSYAVYRTIGGKTLLTSKRRVAGAAIGGWVGLTIASFFAGVEFGIQPFLYHTAEGAPLYAPYPLSLSIPAMVIPHMLVASVIEGVITALIVVYLQRSNPTILEMSERPEIAREASKPRRLAWLWVGLAALIVAVPLGLLAPGTAWGEWNSRQLTNLGLSSVPQGLAQLEGLWRAPMSGYNAPTLGNTSVGYILSAVLGVAIITVVVWLFTRVLTGNRPAASDKQ